MKWANIYKHAKTLVHFHYRLIHIVAVDFSRFRLSFDLINILCMEQSEQIRIWKVRIERDEAACREPENEVRNKKNHCRTPLYCD